MLSTFLEVFEKLLFDLINDDIQNTFSEHLTGFRKNKSTQNALLVLIENWKAIFNKKTQSECSFYGYDNNSVRFLQSYLTNRSQRCNIENNFSRWFEKTTCYPEGFVLGPLLFNLFY